MGFSTHSPWGLKWRRQAPILGWIADFYCPKLQIVLEIDGAGHDGSRDEERDTSMKRIGIYVVRVTADDVFERFEAVTKTLEAVVLR